jgi:hypothetical protein
MHFYKVKLPKFHLFILELSTHPFFSIFKKTFEMKNIIITNLLQM